MRTRVSLFLLAAGIVLLCSGCTPDKNSHEACLHQVTLDLDQGNYAAVLDSPCADAMQRGGAYFERAGFRVRDVINTLSKTKSATSTSGLSAINIYLNTLVPRVTEFTFTDLDGANTEYRSVAATDDAYLDAQFFTGLVEVVKGLSLFKIILDVNGDGVLPAACDMNDDSSPDSIDAASCALFISADLPGLCSAGTSTVYDTLTTPPAAPLTFDESHPGEYRGIILQIDGAGANASGCKDPNQYKQLLHLASSGTHTWAVVTTAPGEPGCLGSDGNRWPCPLMQNGEPVELASTVGGTLADAIGLISSAQTGTSDVKTSLLNLQTNACPSAPCDPSNIANYLQTY